MENFGEQQNSISEEINSKVKLARELCKRGGEEEKSKAASLLQEAYAQAIETSQYELAREINAEITKFLEGEI
jgi:hypothetical protein